MSLRPKRDPDRFIVRATATAAGEGRYSAARLAEQIRICLRREHLRRTLFIGLVVGTILTLINQADVILAGDAGTSTWIKATLNYCVPFVVSNLGLLAGQRAERGLGPP